MWKRDKREINKTAGCILNKNVLMAQNTEKSGSFYVEGCQPFLPDCFRERLKSNCLPDHFATNFPPQCCSTTHDAWLTPSLTPSCYCMLEPSRLFFFSPSCSHKLRQQFLCLDDDFCCCSVNRKPHKSSFSICHCLLLLLVFLSVLLEV
ncbi:hypothetical protein ILYODFUR_020181 [Ilyodon furcidens]|uniref:Uncharacterized protein n=1 Tax=Ilyodon furcidens TaxID=33524 RepID=A0ABV0T013_9TELE